MAMAGMLGGMGGQPAVMPRCDDGVRNGGEVDVDCGGTTRDNPKAKTVKIRTVKIRG